ncbi:MAG: methyltransferase domain-containing protein [Nibricoccus sp.]
MLSFLKSQKPRPHPSFSRRFKQVPRDLVQKVNGNTTEQGFRYIGSQILAGIESELANIAKTRRLERDILADCRQIMDFGSGLGRVILQLAERWPDKEIVGFDIDPLMNKWAKHLLTDKKVRLVSSTLDLPEKSFDLITVISVFTHLDTTTDFWLGEIHRLLKPTGFAFITYQDDTLFEEMRAKGELPAITKLENKYIFGPDSAEGGAGMGAFYTTACWRQTLEKYFNIETIKPRGLFGHQSISIVSPKNVQIDRRPLFEAYAASLERDLYKLRRRFKVSY